MKVIEIFCLQVIVLLIGKCQGSRSGGGPSVFGYDASSACSRSFPRSGRSSEFPDLPCDFHRQNWCMIAGNSYPWHAVRRFVQENQGLMRRMYGVERHINVLKAEFNKYDIELNYDDTYRRPVANSRGFHYTADDDIFDEYEPSKPNRKGTAVSNDPTTTTTKKQSKFPKLSEYTRSSIRTTEGTNFKSNITFTSTEIPVTKTTSIDTTTMKNNITSTIVYKIEENTTINDNATTIGPPIVKTQTEIVKEQNSSINEIPGQVDTLELRVPDEDVELDSIDTTVRPKLSSLIDEDKGGDENGKKQEQKDESEEFFDKVTTEKEEEEEDEDITTTTTKIIETTTTMKTMTTDEIGTNKQQFRPRPEYRPSNRPDISNMEAQLYQDVAAKDQQEQPVLKLRGVNACPVKEEVVAPFWANNTRGEILALLNLPPFEQYVHWEKCTNENKQMYCRDGCRCEQQYRLHRLLAYDPNNECRGIFSDWFKFPSCCVCRCYDLPLEFRVTSRSPRMQKQTINVRPPRIDFP